MFSPFMYNVEKWPNTALFLTYVWPFFKIMLERVKEIFVKIFLQKETLSATNLKVRILSNTL